MGNTASSTNVQQYKSTIVNKDDISILNESINQSISNTIVNQAKNCSASISQLQDIDLAGTTVEGNFNLGPVNQTQSSALTFSCVTLSEFQNQLANNMLAKYSNSLSTAFSTEAETKLNAAAEAAATSGFAATGSTNTNSTNLTNYNYNEETDVNKNIQNVVKNVINNNLNISDMQSCISNIKGDQSVNLSGMTVHGNMTIQAINQTQASSLASECVLKSNNANNASTAIANALGITVNDENSIKKTTAISSTAAAESVNRGVFESLGAGLSTAFQGFGSMLGSIFGSPVILLVCCVGIVIALCAAYYFLMGGGSGSGGSFFDIPSPGNVDYNDNVDADYNGNVDYNNNADGDDDDDGYDPVVKQYGGNLYYGW